MIVVYDTETTGLMPGQICQLSMVLDDGSGARGVNRFFSVDYISPQAQAVNGFTKEALEDLSGNLRFADAAQDILAEFRGAQIAIAHNLEFDQRFLSAELRRAGIRYRHRRGLCTMTFFTKMMGLTRAGKPKPPSLNELCAYLGVEKEDAKRFAQQLFGQENAMAHDARYDAAATYLCVRAAIAQGKMRDLFARRAEGEIQA